MTMQQTNSRGNKSNSRGGKRGGKEGAVGKGTEGEETGERVEGEGRGV